MKPLSRHRLTFTITLLILALADTHAADELRLTRAEYTDRVNAIWHGQIIAVLVTLPFEHKTAAVEPVTGFPKPYTHAFVDDDWYYEMCAVRAFEKHGLGLTVLQLGEQWLENSCGSYGSSKVALANLRRGIAAPDCGHPRYNRLWWTIGPVFSTELYGALAPGMPNVAARMAREYGHINGFAEAVDGAVFTAGAISLGFVERNPQAIVRAAVRLLHPSSPYRQCVELVIGLADAGGSFEEIVRTIEDRWHIEYPASNNAVPNGGIAAAALWFGAGDFWKTINLAAGAADYTDTDNSAAGAIAVIAAMHGMKALPPELVDQLQDRIAGTEMGRVPLTPPVDETISGIARRSVAIGEKIIATNGGKRDGESWTIPPQVPVEQAAERFTLAELTQFWNPDWTLERAGFGGDGVGAMPGIRGLTALDGDVLITYPRDEARGLLLRRTMTLGAAPVLEVQVAAEPKKAWELLVHAGNRQLHRQIITGNDEGLQWQAVRVDLQEYAGRKTALRLYQRTLLPGTFQVPSNAYWKVLQVR